MSRRPVRRRGRARQRAVHGQGRLQGSDGARRAAPDRLPRRRRSPSSRATVTARARRARRARPAGVRQARAARLIGRDQPGRATGRRWQAPWSSRSNTIRSRSSRRSPTAWRSNARSSATSIRSPRQPGEILLAAGEQGWYDYEAKYTRRRHAADRARPARSRRLASASGALAVEAFRRSGCAGLARVDFFVVGEEVLVNELNTMPGFTETSVYAALFAASGHPVRGTAGPPARARDSSVTPSTGATGFNPAHEQRFPRLSQSRSSARASWAPASPSRLPSPAFRSSCATSTTPASRARGRADRRLASAGCQGRQARPRRRRRRHAIGSS